MDAKTPAQSGSVASPPPERQAAEDEARTDTRRPWLRRVLLIAGPVLVAAAALWFYLSGGRFVTEENAYVQAETVAISPQVSGQVARIAVKNNQHVNEGDLLFSLDPEPFEIAVAGARAERGVVLDQLAGLVQTYHSRQAQIDQAQANLTYAQSEYDRIRNLVKRGVSSQAQLEQAQRDLQVAQAALSTAQQEAATILAQLGGDGDGPVERRAQYKKAQAAVDTAERNLRLTEIHAPFAGIATNVDAIQTGLFLSAGQQAMSLVSTNDMWVQANLKETDLQGIRAGAPVRVQVDAYPGVTFQGEVRSIDPASGSVFSVLPAQNASGNWVKVVQRIPVQIGIRPNPKAPPLRAGMSATVAIDTGRERTLAGLWRDIISWV